MMLLLESSPPVFSSETLFKARWPSKFPIFPPKSSRIVWVVLEFMSIAKLPTGKISGFVEIRKNGSVCLHTSNSGRICEALSSLQSLSAALLDVFDL